MLPACDHCKRLSMRVAVIFTGVERLRTRPHLDIGLWHLCWLS
jgi:hypothetical protein